MPTLLVVGGGLFGSLAAAVARSRGVEAVVFDPGLPGAASPAAAGLFKEAWAGRRLAGHFREALPVLERLYGVRSVTLRDEHGGSESLLFVPPAAILHAAPWRERVTAVGDGWLEAGGVRHVGHVLVANGVWASEFFPGLGVYGKAGSAFLFAGECDGQTRQVAHGRQAVAFVRDAGLTHFADGTAERDHTADHDRQTLERAATLGLTGPVARLWGRRPYAPGGPRFERVSGRTWVATGGRKMGTVLGAAFAVRLVEESGL